MAKLKTIPEDATAYREMTAALLPRGPIWTLDNAGVRGMAGGLGVEAIRFHNRLVALMLEAYPSTATELLAEWERVFGLPLCADAPTSLSDRQAALAGRVAAQGGQDRAYYIGIVRTVLGDPEAVVTIVENPYGTPFYAWLGHAWDLLGGEGVRAYWQVILPSGVSPAQQHIIECLLNEYKPAHTVLEVISAVSAYYESLDGSDGLSYLEASTNLAARLCLPGTGSIASFTLIAWVAQLDSPGRGIAQIGDPAADAIVGFAEGRDVQSFSAMRAGTPIGDGGALPPDDDSYFLLEVASDGSIVALTANGASYAVVSVSGSFAVPADLFRLLSGYGDGADGARIRNIALMSGALTSDERTALLDADYTHDYRTDYDDGAGHVWTGRTPPFYWCTPAILHSPIHIYTAEPGETIEASGYTTMPDPEDSTFGVWFRVTNSGDGVIVRIPPTGPGYHGLAIPSGANDGTTFDLEWHDNSYGTYAVGEWLLLTLTNDGGEITANINDSDNYNLGSEALDGDFILGTEAGLTADIQVEFAQPFFTASRRTPTETAALYAAGHLHPVNEASGAWPAIALPIVYQGGLTGSVIDNGGNGAAHPMSFTGTPNAVPSGPVASVVNSGSAGECDLDLYGDTTSEED